MILKILKIHLASKKILNMLIYKKYMDDLDKKPSIKLKIKYLILLPGVLKMEYLKFQIFTLYSQTFKTL